MAVFSSTQNTAACWGGLNIQANNISRLELELRVVGSHLAFDPMGLKPGALPHPRHHHMANAQVPGQLAAAPVRGAIRRRSARPFQNPGLQRRGSLLHRPPTMARVQSGQSLNLETPLPATNIVRVATELLANRQVGLALRQQQDQPRPAHILGRQGARTHSYPSVPRAPSASIETLLQAMPHDT